MPIIHKDGQGFQETYSWAFNPVVLSPRSTFALQLEDEQLISLLQLGPAAHHHNLNCHFVQTESVCVSGSYCRFICSLSFLFIQKCVVLSSSHLLLNYSIFNHRITTLHQAPANMYDNTTVITWSILIMGNETTFKLVWHLFSFNGPCKGLIFVATITNRL